MSGSPMEAPHARTIRRRDVLRLGAAAAATVAQSRSARAQRSPPLRIGYWATGIQLALIELIQSRKIFEKYGLAYELVRFADVNGNTLALATDQIDAAFSVSGAGALDLASKKRPIRIVLLTQTADGQLVTKSPEIKSIADLRGKLIGMAPAGSAGAALTKAFLSRNFGLEQSAYRPVGGGEARLLQLVAQGEVAAALLREVSWVQYQKRLGLRSLADQRSEWKRIAGTDAVPPLGLGVVREKILNDRRTDAVAFVAAIMDGINAGAADRDAVADLMAKTLRLEPDEAKAYADTWSISFHGKFQDTDVHSLELAERLFVEEKTLGAVAEPAFFDQGVYRDAVTRLT